MKLVDKYYGYPVLSTLSDDYLGKFEFGINASLNDEEQIVEFNVIITLNNEEILNLIKEGKASFMLHLEESKTCYREIVKFDSIEHTFSVPYGRIRESLEAILFVVATKRIENFSSESIHTFYKGHNISYEQYQMIAISNYNLVEIVKEPDEIKTASSIFIVIPDKSKKEEIIKIDLQEERIVITMPEDDFKLYDRLSRQNRITNFHREILLSNIVMPVMVEVFQLLKDSEGLYERRIWYKSIVEAYEKKNIDIVSELQKEDFSPLKFSQIIFDNVIQKAMKQVESLLEG